MVYPQTCSGKLYCFIHHKQYSNYL